MHPTLEQVHVFMVEGKCIINVTMPNKLRHRSKI